MGPEASPRNRQRRLLRSSSRFAHRRLRYVILFCSRCIFLPLVLACVTCCAFAQDRLSRIKLTRKEKHDQVVKSIVQMATSGQLREKIDDTRLIEVRGGAMETVWMALIHSESVMW